MKKENIPTNQTVKSLAKIAENQKLPKPLIEKKRRARINRSLSELRILISDLLKKELMRTRSKRKSGKVEKADVLDFAVQYIKEMKQEKSVQKELAFEAGYILCQQNVENYFRKIKELSKQSTDATKSDCSNVQCKQKAYLVQKDLLKTLDQQWTEHVQNTNYNRKIDEQRLMQFDNQEKTTIEITSANDLNKQLTAQAEKASTSSDNQFNQFSHPADSVSSINPNSSINEKMNTLTLQSLNSSKHPLKSGGTSIPKKYYPTMWKDKPLSKADELMSIKLYNEIVMHNLNRNKSLCSSASSTSSCSSASSYAKTISSLNSNHHLTNHHSTNGQLARVMPVDLESNANLPSSDCSVNSSSSSQSPVIKTQSIMSKYSHSNSPFKKRKKIYQYAFDSSSSTSSDSLWRPW